jgi:hypothetical protein
MYFLNGVPKWAQAVVAAILAIVALLFAGSDRKSSLRTSKPTVPTTNPTRQSTSTSYGNQANGPNPVIILAGVVVVALVVGGAVVYAITGGMAYERKYEVKNPFLSPAATQGNGQPIPQQQEPEPVVNQQPVHQQAAPAPAASCTGFWDSWRNAIKSNNYVYSLNPRPGERIEVCVENPDHSAAPISAVQLGRNEKFLPEELHELDSNGRYVYNSNDFDAKGGEIFLRNVSSDDIVVSYRLVRNATK